MALRCCRALSRLAARPRIRYLAGAPSPPPPPGEAPKTEAPKVYRQRLLDGAEEVLTEEEKQEKDQIIKDLTRRLSGPLADEDGNVPTGEDRPIAIEVDGPSHFYANSKRYTAYTKLKHRLLTRMGYKVLHVPYYEWRSLRGAAEREDYMRKKLKEEPSEWLDPEDEKYYTKGPDEDEEEFSVKPEAPVDEARQASWPSAPQPPPRQSQAAPRPPPSQPTGPPPQPPMPPMPPAKPRPPSHGQQTQPPPGTPPGPPPKPGSSAPLPPYPSPPKK